MTLLEKIRAQSTQANGLTFMEFMQLALYAPAQGYYSAHLTKLGPAGDFITAPEMTPLFGKTLANQCRQVLQSLHTPCILEFGAGTGILCVDVLTHLEHLQCLPECYYILEVSSNLRHRQHELIQQKIPHLASRVCWLDEWPTHRFNGVIIANEVLDAMPIHRFLRTEEQVFESYIRCNEQQQLEEQFQVCTNQRLVDYVNNHVPYHDGPYVSEVNLFITDWINNLYAMLDQGAVFLIDYGFPRHEYYHPDRQQGTIMCHYQHQSHTNPLIHVGEQDITAHVDFTHVAEAAHDAGFHVAGYTNQASFLLANDLLNFLNCIDTEADLFTAKQAVKQLTHPSEMGELFKVIALTKDLDLALYGFLLNDKRVSL